jgi:hypothetical protein
MTQRLLETAPSTDPAVGFVPVADYAQRPWPAAFVELTGALEPLLLQTPEVEAFDVTAFYSRRWPNLPQRAENELLNFNQQAFNAAQQIGGLVVYYQGERVAPDSTVQPDPELNLGFVPDCLSFCIWQSRQQALNGADVRAHSQAVRRVDQWYENFAIKKYVVLGGTDITIRATT